MSWTSLLTAAVSLLNSFKSLIIAGITYAVGKEAGRKAEQDEQTKRDLEAIAAAERARRNVANDDSMQHDKYNRDI